MKRRGVLPDDTIGVISFGSTSPGSGLLNLLQEQADQSAPLRTFWKVSQLVFEAILAAVLRQSGGSETIPEEGS